MTHTTVTTRATAASTLTALLLGVFAVGLPLISDVTPVFAQETDSEVDPEAARAAEREKAKQQRIEEYLRKREERRARQTQERLEKESAKAQKSAAAADPAAAETPLEAELAEGEEPAEILIPQSIAEIHTRLRAGPLGQNPTVVNYMELIERADASPSQLAAFGNFLSQNGMTRDAVEYYALALSIEQEDPVLWLNVGTLHRQLGEFSTAEDTYRQSLALDPNNGYAHYNLASVLDSLGKYDEAIAEYRTALLLDPNLGDPTVNPQAANNDRLLAVKLMIYKEQEGAVGLPLVEVPGGSPESDAP